MFRWVNHLQFNLGQIILFILVIVGIGYGCYTTVLHFQAASQLNEARKAMDDIRLVLIWSVKQQPNAVVKTCNFNNIQHVIKQDELKRMNQLLNWNLNIVQQTQYVEHIKVYAMNDLHTCMIKAYFKNNHFVSEHLAGKYIAYQYDLKNNKTECLTDIEKYSLVKSCTRL